MAIQIGQPAPDFSLYNTDKQLVHLSDFKGRPVLLLFFPFAFSSVCTTELCSVRDNFKVYEDFQAQPIGISVDSLYTLKKFKEEQHLNFPLLSDFNKDVSKAYGVLYEKFSYGMQGVSRRAAFIVDKDGIIQYAEVLENASEQPNFSGIKAKLASLE